MLLLFSCVFRKCFSPENLNSKFIDRNIPAAKGEYRRAELRSPDPLCNPYLAFALLIHAGLAGIQGHFCLPEAADINLYTAPKEVCEKFETLPESLDEAKKRARESDFVMNFVFSRHGRSLN